MKNERRSILSFKILTLVEQNGQELFIFVRTWKFPNKIFTSTEKKKCETAGTLPPWLSRSQYVSELFWIPCELQKLN